MRPTHFAGSVTGDSVSPRFGATLTIPRIRWTFRAFYGHYYQAPPLLTASGSLKELCTQPGNSCDFIPLNGERDEESPFGVTIPLHGWTFDAGHVPKSRAKLFRPQHPGRIQFILPLTIERALIRGWELTVRSPRLAHRAQVILPRTRWPTRRRHSGGLTDFAADLCDIPALECPLRPGSRPAQYPQRWRRHLFTLAFLRFYERLLRLGVHQCVSQQSVSRRKIARTSTFDASLGKDFGELFSASINALNVANRRIELDNSVTFGGFTGTIRGKFLWSCAIVFTTRLPIIPNCCNGLRRFKTRIMLMKRIFALVPFIFLLVLLALQPQQKIPHAGRRDCERHRHFRGYRQARRIPGRRWQ